MDEQEYKSGGGAGNLSAKREGIPCPWTLLFLSSWHPASAPRRLRRPTTRGYLGRLARTRRRHRRRPALWTLSWALLWVGSYLIWMPTYPSLLPLYLCLSLPLPLSPPLRRASLPFLRRDASQLRRQGSACGR